MIIDISVRTNLQLPIGNVNKVQLLSTIVSQLYCNEYKNNIKLTTFDCEIGLALVPLRPQDFYTSISNKIYLEIYLDL